MLISSADWRQKTLLMFKKKEQSSEKRRYVASHEKLRKQPLRSGKLPISYAISVFL